MEPSTQQQPVAPQQPVKTGKSGDPFKLWTIVFAILFLAAAGSAVWQTLQLNEQSTKLNSLQTSVTQLEAEKVALQSQVTELGGTTTPTGDETETTSADSAKILAAVDAYVRAPVEATGNFEYSIKTKDDSFAIVTVTVPEGGGYMLWAKKVGDNWTVLFGGQEGPSQELIDKYGLKGEFAAQ